MKNRRLKVLAASIIILTAMVLLVVSGIRKTSVRHYSPAGLIANAETADAQNIQVDGVISEGSSTWDAANFKLTFAVREREGTETINVIYEDNLKPDNFNDGGSVYVEGRYDAEKNSVVATKVQTKCASKYEGVDSPKDMESYE